MKKDLQHAKPIIKYIIPFIKENHITFMIKYKICVKK